MRPRDLLDPVAIRLIPRILHPPFTPPIVFLRQQRPSNRFLRAIASIRAQNYDLIVVERIVEIPFVFTHLGVPVPSRVLDFGGTGSPLAIHIASMGHDVTIFDLRPYGFEHPNLHEEIGDFLAGNVLEGSFDLALAVSAIEHVGLAAYGEGEFADGDVLVMAKLLRSLRSGGRLILTVPFGRPGRTAWYRVYDRASLAQLAVGFDVVEAEYYEGIGRTAWTPSTPERLETIDSVDCGFAQGVACIVGVKR
jgi:SAM-dependent methyltransferase